MNTETTAKIQQAAAELHGDFADVVLIVAGVHTAAAQVHHDLRHDPLLRRMCP